MALAAPTVSPVTDSDKHLITILVEAETGATLVKLERREHYTKVETVRGTENTLMTEDSIFVADYEAAQNVTVEYKATVEKDGQTAESDWVLADQPGHWQRLLFHTGQPVHRYAGERGA